MTDYYKTLEIDKTASADDIKIAYRKLANKYHPDKIGGDVKQFQTIQEAYDTLSDPAKRQQYDNPQPQFQHFGGPGGFEFHFGGGGGDPFQDIFAQFFGGQQVRPNTRVNLELDLDLAATGGKRIVGIAGQNIELNIPEGVQSGQEIRYPGLGQGGTDLIVQFRVRPHPEFERRGNDLFCTRTLTFWDLILGATLEIRNIKGNMVSIVVPPKTRPGTVLRARGHGILGHSLLVELQAILPHSIPDDLVEQIRIVRDQQ